MISKLHSVIIHEIAMSLKVSSSSVPARLKGMSCRSGPLCARQPKSPPCPPDPQTQWRLLGAAQRPLSSLLPVSGAPRSQGIITFPFTYCLMIIPCCLLVEKALSAMICPQLTVIVTQTNQSFSLEGYFAFHFYSLFLVNNSLPVKSRCILPLYLFRNWFNIEFVLQRA